MGQNEANGTEEAFYDTEDFLDSSNNSDGDSDDIAEDSGSNAFEG